MIKKVVIIDYGMGNLLINNKMGRFAYADSSSMIYNQFISLYRDRDLCKELGSFGFDFCCNNLSVEKSYLDILEHISDTTKERKTDVQVDWDSSEKLTKGSLKPNIKSELWG